MATPIQPTPTVTGEDADELQRSLEQVADPAEIARRRQRAREYIAEVSRPKLPR